MDMESLWKSFHTPVKSGHSGSNTAHLNRPTSSLQQLLIILASSGLSNLSINHRIHSTTGAYLGRGATYTVERREATGKRVVAVKHIRRDDDQRLPKSSESGISRLRLESVLLELRVLLHPFLRRQRNIIKLVAHGWDDEIFPFLVMEFADLGTASRYLQDRDRSWNDMARLVADVSSGLAALHDCAIVHGDVKLENVLIFSEVGGGFVAKISDFGFCVVEILGECQYLGTRLLNAPEVRHPEYLHTVRTDLAFMKCDVYSFGLLAWESFNNGERFYTSKSIGIGSDEHERAEEFLSTLEEAGSTLTSYGEDFVQNLDCVSRMKEFLLKVMAMTLRWSPSSRPQMVEIHSMVPEMFNSNPDTQLTSAEFLDLDHRSESGVDVPNSEKNLGLDLPLFVFFDIGLAQLPWQPRRQLVKLLIEGAQDIHNSFAGQDCFHIAACYALGYGLEINEAESLAYLTRAADLSYKPAIVLTKCFEVNRLLKRDIVSQEGDSHSQFDKFIEGADLISPAALPSYLVKAYYTHQRISDQVGGYFFEDQFHPLTKAQSLIDRVLNMGPEDIGHLYVEVTQSDEIRVVPVMHFLMNCYPDIAQLILEQGFDGLSIDDSGISILNTACALGSRALTKTIVQLFPDLTWIPSKDGTTPLHWLFMFEPKDMVEIGKLLTAGGARLNAPAVREFPEFNLVLSGPPLHWAIMVRNEAAVRTLLDLGASMSNNAPYPSHYKMYPWHALSLATCFFMPEIVQILLDAGAPVDSEGSEEELTALHSLADACDPFRLWYYHGPNVERAARETVGVLLQAGADLNVLSDVTPLEWTTSVATCLTWAIEALLVYKPSTKLSHADDDSNKSLILTAATSLQHDQVNGQKMRLLLEYTSSELPRDQFVAQCISGLEECARHGMNGAIQEILRYVLPLSKNVIEEEGLLPLATENDQVDMVALLLKAGASINHDDGGTAAACAAFHCSHKSLRLLLERGAGLLCAPTDGSTATLLHEVVRGYAPAKETFKTLSMLHEHFQDRFAPIVNNFDNRGRTALHSAIICGQLQNIAILLEKFGADPNIPIRDSSVNSTTLAMLARKFPSAYTRMFSEGSRKQYDEDMVAVLEYLTGTWRLPAPDIGTSEHWVTSLWERENYFPEGDADIDWAFIDLVSTERDREVDSFYTVTQD